MPWLRSLRHAEECGKRQGPLSGTPLSPCDTSLYPEWRGKLPLPVKKLKTVALAFFIGSRLNHAKRVMQPLRVPAG